MDEPRGDERPARARVARHHRRRRRRRPRWRPPTRASAPRCTSSRAAACSAARSRSPANSSPSRSTELGVDLHLGVPDRAGRAHGRRRVPCSSSTTGPSSRPTRSWSRPAGSRAPATSGSRPSASRTGDWLDVDDTLRVLGDDGEALDGGWLYAVGDVNHRALLTHQGKYQARAAGDVIAARAHGPGRCRWQPWGALVATADHEAVPQVTFTDPEVASVGLTAAAAEKAGYRIRVVDYEIGCVAGARVRRRRLRGHGPHGRRRGPQGRPRRHLRRAGRRRAAALGDDRRRRRGAARPALARRPVVPDHQRGLAAAARDVRAAPE